MKYFLSVTVFLFLFLFLPRLSYAIVDPVSVPNNRFGIHIIDQNDIPDAIRLVNSSGGDWGYVTIVMTLDDRKKEKWQDIFDSMRRNHLIPIIRLATRLDGDKWLKPEKTAASSWADFLNSLNWVTTNRYIVLFNEPNHAKEWGGDINPTEYVEILKTYRDELKRKSEDFFILPAGFDASAPNGIDTMDEDTFLYNMNSTIPGIFNELDGWTSHSYPNPNFSASPVSSGRGSVKTYEWELQTLKKYGLSKDLPIFITETGWTNSSLTPETIASHFRFAFANVWNDPQIIAVTPFILNYPQFPFEVFSWKNTDGTFQNQYFEVIEIAKIKGTPIQEVKILWQDESLPQTLVTDSNYHLSLRIKNEGQAIFAAPDDFSVNFSAPGFSNVKLETIPIEPFRDGPIDISFYTPNKKGVYQGEITISHKGNILLSKSYQFTIIEPPQLIFKVNSLFNSINDNQNTILIYDKNEYLIGIYENVYLNDGVGAIDNLRNVAVGEKYRVVFKKPYYLPRQTHLDFTQGLNSASFKPIIPFDLDLDGNFSFNDYFIMIFHPVFTLSLIF